MKLFVKIIVLSFFTASIISCEKEIKKQDYELFSSIIKEKTKVDSLILNKPLAFKHDHEDTISIPNEPYLRRKITYSITPLVRSNKIGLGKSDTIKKDQDTICYKTKPKVVKLKPYIAFAQQPTPVKAGELRSNGISNENVMYLTDEQGLPTSAINDIKFDRKGFMWIAHNRGLTRYDGYNFYTYNIQKGLPSNFITKIIIDSSNNLWLGTTNGVAHFDGTRFLIYNKVSGLVDNLVQDLTLDNNDHLWFLCADKAIYKLTGEKALMFDDPNLHPPSFYHIHADSLNNIVIGGFGENVRFLINENKIVRYSGNNAFYGSYITTAIYSDKNKHLWYGSYNGGGIHIDGKKSFRYFPETGFPYNIISSFYHDNDGKMWMGTAEGGLARIEENGFTVYTTKQGLTSNRITAIAGDEQNNIWIATQDGGLNRIKPNSFRNYSSLDGLSDKSFYSVTTLKNDEIAIGTWGDGIYTFNGKRFARIYDPYGFDVKIMLSMSTDEKGDLYTGLHANGVFKLHATPNDSLPFDSIYLLSGNEKMANNYAYRMHTTIQNEIWISAKNGEGLNSIKNGFYKHYSALSGLASNELGAVTSDSKGNVFVINENCGISKINKNTIQHYTKANGLPHNTATTLFTDSKDQIWIGTANGLSIYNGTSFLDINQIDGLSSPLISNIIEDHKHRIWVGTQKGLNCLIPDPSKPKGYAIETFYLQDGLKSNTFMANGVTFDSTNTLWWVTPRGLLSLNLDEFDVKNQSPTTYLELVTIMGDVINFPALQDSINKNSNYFGSDSLRIYNKIKFNGTEPFFHYPKDLQLTYNLNNVTFNFYALEGNSPHRINYHYRLIGLDESWNEIDYPEVKFTNLDPGSYTFEAEAKIIGKPWGTKLSYSFEIRPPFWETWWFRLLMIASTIGIVVSIFRLRNKQLIARQVHLEKTVKERTLEIEEKKALIEEKQKEIVDSINYAKRIQYALLAHEDLLKENLPSYFIYFNPKDIVSGDFYWATKKDDRFYIAVCDSTGHGVPGAFMSLLSIGFLTEAINEKGIEKPNEIFDFVRDRLITNLSKEGQK
ncbi:MAG: two-component regulator propeller domain-containing protein, partial [Sphingobacteriaceae bacterium]